MRISAFFLIVGALIIGIILGQIPMLQSANPKIFLVIAVIFLLIGSIFTEVQKEEEDELRKKVR